MPAPLQRPSPYSVAYRPASVAFHWGHGVGVVERALWEFHDHLHRERWRSERLSTDPERYRIELRRGDDALRVTVEEGADVTRTERVRRLDGR